METLHITRELTSETLPELKPWIGRTVEIVVRDSSTVALPAGATPGTGDWDAFDQAAEAMRQSFDFYALREQEQCDLIEAGARPR